MLKWARKRWKLGRPKTRSSVRRISLSPKLVAVLRPLVADKTGDDHVFTMVEGGPLHHGNFYNRYFRPAVKVAGKPVPSRLRIHDLRHTHAAWLLSDGVPVFVVQRRLGHSSSATTENVYGHLTPDADDRTLRLVDRRLPDVLVRDESQLRSVMAANPFPDFARERPSTFLVYFLRGEVSGDLGDLRPFCVLGEEVAAGPGCLYLCYPDGSGKSKLSGATIERKLKVRGTGRNWNTVGKLVTKLGGQA